MKRIGLFLAIVVAVLPSVAYAKPLEQKDTDAIVQKFQSDYADTFNRRDAKAMGALLTENATMQNEWGDVKQGRSTLSHLSRD